MRVRRLCCLVAAALPAWAFAAPPAVGYAQATGYFKKETRPTLYQPLNVLDGREITAWCTPGADSLSEQLRIGFKGVAKIDEIRVYTGNGADDASFQEFSRAKKVSIKGAHAARTFTVSDQRGLQSIPLNPPLQDANFTIEVLDQYPAEDPEAPVCITDLVFYSEGKALNGPWLTPKLKFDKARSPILGTWYGGYEGAPERFLSFFIDGTFRFVYEPIDTTKKGRTLQGDYDISGSRVTVTYPGKGKVSGKLKKDKTEAGGPAHTVTFESASVPEELKEAFREQP